MKVRIRKMKFKMGKIAVLFSSALLLGAVPVMEGTAEEYLELEPFPFDIMEHEDAFEETQGTGISLPDAMDAALGMETGEETENDSDTEPEYAGTETDSAGDEWAAMQRALIQTLAKLPEGFRYPMMQPEWRTQETEADIEGSRGEEPGETSEENTEEDVEKESWEILEEGTERESGEISGENTEEDMEKESREISEEGTEGESGETAGESTGEEPEGVSGKGTETEFGETSEENTEDIEKESRTVSEEGTETESGEISEEKTEEDIEKESGESTGEESEGASKEGTEGESGEIAGESTGEAPEEASEKGTEKESREIAEKDTEVVSERNESPDADAETPLPSRLYGLTDLSELRQLHGFHLVFFNLAGGEPDYEELHRKERFKLLKVILENRISVYDGAWSVYVKNLTTDESFVINDMPMKSASVMKLFILGTVYKAFEAGELERTEEVMSLVNNMITVSDNASSNQLLHLLGESSYEKGIEKVNAFIAEYGFSDMTREYNGFEDSSLVFDSDHSNQVSAKDCGKFLEDIYRRTWINRTASNEIEQLLLNQHTRYKIPAGLPEGVLCGNKTGEMSTTENDAAIIYADNCDYILVVLSSEWSDKDTAISRIAGISRVVYEYLN